MSAVEQLCAYSIPRFDDHFLVSACFNIGPTVESPLNWPTCSYVYFKFNPLGLAMNRFSYKFLIYMENSAYFWKYSIIQNIPRFFIPRSEGAWGDNCLTQPMLRQLSLSAIAIMKIYALLIHQLVNIDDSLFDISHFKHWSFLNISILIIECAQFHSYFSLFIKMASTDLCYITQSIKNWCTIIFNFNAFKVLQLHVYVSFSFLSLEH
jgi:hypothetical protein